MESVSRSKQRAANTPPSNMFESMANNCFISASVIDVSIAILVTLLIIIIITLTACMRIRRCIKRRSNSRGPMSLLFNSPPIGELVLVNTRPHTTATPLSYYNAPPHQSAQWSNVGSRIESVVRSTMREFEIPGLIVSVRHDGHPLVEYASGYTTRPYEHDTTLMSPHYSFRIGSVTKTMTAVATLTLEQQGWLSLDDTIDRWFPEYENAKLISIRHLLTMTSGLGNYGNASQFETIFNADPRLHWDTRDLVRWGAGEKTLFDPGNGWDYCNTNFVLLGRIIEIIAQYPLDVVFEMLLFGKLGMRNTFLATDASWRDAEHAHGYGVFRDGGAIEDCTDWNPMWAWSAGGVISNVDDMHIWATNLGSGAPLRQPNWSGAHDASSAFALLVHPMADTSSVHTPAAHRPPFERLTYFYGLGVMFDDGWIYHNGSIPGFETICAAHPASGLTIVLSSNQTTLPKFKATSSAITHLFKRIALEFVEPAVHVQ